LRGPIALETDSPRRRLARAAEALLPVSAMPASLPRLAFGAAMGATLALLPFERYVGSAVIGPLTVTGLEVAWGLAVLAWLAVLTTERRPPALPWPVAAALILLFVAGLISAALAGPQAGEALKFLARSCLGWLLFAATADLVRTERDARRLVAYVLAGTTLAAIVGLVALWLGPGDQLGLIGREFAVGGVRRLQGPFDYPNTGAMAWEASGLAGFGLVAVATGRWPKLAVAAGLVIVTAAMLLTLSRGASLGGLGGLGAISLLAIIARRRRLAVMPLLAAAAIAAGTVVVQLSGLPQDRLLGIQGDTDFYGATYRAPALVRTAPGVEARVNVTLLNTGSATWNASSTDDYRLAYRWLEPSTGHLVRNGGQRAVFVGPVAPTEEVSVTASIEVPTETGEYLVAWDLVHEGTAWFSEKGVPVATTRLLVGGPTSGDAPTIAPGALVELFPGLRPVPDRGQLWNAAVAMIGERPLVGTGPGTFRLRYGSYLGWDRWDERVHANNMYLELGATTGLIGLAAFVALVGFVLFRQLRLVVPRPPSGANPRTDAGWMFRAALVGAVVAFLIHGLVDYFLGFNPTAGLFWALLGIGLGIALGRSGGQVPSSPATQPPAPSR
jgi:hypothetical protein